MKENSIIQKFWNVKNDSDGLRNESIVYSFDTLIMTVSQIFEDDGIAFSKSLVGLQYLKLIFILKWAHTFKYSGGSSMW